MQWRKIVLKHPTMNLPFWISCFTSQQLSHYGPKEGWVRIKERIIWQRGICHKKQGALPVVEGGVDLRKKRSKHSLRWAWVFLLLPLCWIPPRQGRRRTCRKTKTVCESCRKLTVSSLLPCFMVQRLPASYRSQTFDMVRAIMMIAAKERHYGRGST